MEGDGTHGAVQADVIDAAAMLRTEADAAAAGGGGAARQLPRSIVRPRQRPRRRRSVPDPAATATAQAPLSYQLPDDARLELVGLFAGDEIARTVTTSDPTFTKRDDRDVSFYRTWARYHRTFKDASVADAVAYFGNNHAGLVNQFGGPETSLSEDDKVYGLPRLVAGRARDRRGAGGRPRRGGRQLPAAPRGRDGAAAARRRSARLRPAAARRDQLRRLDRAARQRRALRRARSWAWRAIASTSSLACASSRT